VTTATDPVITITPASDIIIHSAGDAKVLHLFIMANRGFGELTFPGKKDLYPQGKESKSCHQDRQYEYFYQHTAKIIKDVNRK
jgi:hypothetical protein